MAQRKSHLRSTSRLLALEPRLLFDGAGMVAAQDAIHADTADAAASDAPASDAPASDSAPLGKQRDFFTTFAAAPEAPELGSLEGAKNTSEDGKVSVGEDDAPSAVLKDWEIKGNGSITVSIGGAQNGTLHANGGLTFTGSAAEVTAWLDSVTYQYKTTNQSQTGDTDSITLTITDKNGSKSFTQEIAIAPQNDAPTYSGNGEVLFSVDEGGTFKFSAPLTSGSGFTESLLGISDPDNSAKQVIIKLESIPDPAHGQLVLTRGGQEIILAAGSTLSVAELGNLKYVHLGTQVSPANGSAPTPNQSFTFTIDDGAGGRLTGQKVEFELKPVNQAPAISGKVTIVEGEQNVSLGLGGSLIAKDKAGKNITILSDRGHIAGVDPDDSQLSYRITSLPPQGKLYYDGVELTASNMGTLSITDLKKLTYSYPDELEPSDHNGEVKFEMDVIDNGGGAGADHAETTHAVITLTILENNDDPHLTANNAQDYGNLETAEKPFIITPDMLGVSDPDSFDSNLVFSITGVSDLNYPGYFTVDGKLLAPGTSFTMADVKADKVQYHLRTSSTEVRTDSITFTVTDSNTGLLFGPDGQVYQRDGGIYDSNDPQAKLTELTFKVTVPAATPGDEGELPGLPDQAATLEVGGSGKMDNVKESEGTAVDSGDGVPLTDTMLNTVAKDKNGLPLLTIPADKIVYRLETAPQSGSLWLKVEGRNPDGSGNGVWSWKQLGQFDSFTQKDIAGGNVVFRHDGGEQFQDEFQFSVSNGSITTSGLSTFSISIYPQNDTPTASQNPNQSLNVIEGGTVVINGDNLTHIILSDSDQGNASHGGYDNKNELWFVVEALPQHGKLIFTDKNGVKTVIDESNKANIKITQAELNAGKLSYEHDSSENFTDSFKIRPYDDQNVTEAEKTPTNQVSKGEAVDIHITIAPDNDPPKLETKNPLKDTGAGNHGLYEGGTATIYGEKIPAGVNPPYGQLAYADPDNDPDQIQYRVTKAPEYGQLLLDGKALSVGSVFTQADLDAGRITYKHNGGQTHSDSFEYLVSDGDYTVNDNGDHNKPTPSEFEIQVKPSNDQPIFSEHPSKPVIIDGTDFINNIVGGFQIKDVDTLGTDNGEVDLITVIVRVIDKDGKMLTGVDYTLALQSTDELKGTFSANSGYLIFTGSVGNVNKALQTLGVGFADDLNSKDYQLQVIVDDRLNANGKDYQNGGSNVIANGGDKNQDGNKLPDIDNREYKWATDVITPTTSLNLNVSSVVLWVSTVNDAPDIPVVPQNVVVDEDVPTKLTGFKFTDKESEVFGTWVEVTLNVNSGTLTAQNLPDGITVEGNGTANITLRGSVTALNNYLNSSDKNSGVFYKTAANVNHDTNNGEAGDVTLKITLDEGESNIGDPEIGGSGIGDDEGKGSVKNDSVTREVAITITAINDAPTVTAPPDKSIVIDSDGVFEVGKHFGLADVDTEDGYAPGEQDGTLQLTIRLLDANGNPLAKTEYVDYDVELKGTGSVTVDSTRNGAQAALVVRGTLQQLQEYLKTVSVAFKSTSNQADRYFRLEVILDDRLRNPDGTLTGTANGGEKNQDANGNISNIPTKDTFNPYADLLATYQVANLASNSITLFVSTSNDAAEIKGGLEAGVENDAGQVTLKGLTIKDSDAQPDDLLTVTVSVPQGLSIANVGGNGGIVKIAGDTVTITGTLTQINARLNAIVVNLPANGAFDSNVDSSDWHGQFTVTVTVNDHGNTGVTSDPKTGTDASGNPIRGAVTEQTFTMLVKPVNDAPTFSDKADVVLPSAQEDSTGPAQTVRDWFEARFDDSKDNLTGSAAGADTFWGIAVVGNQATAQQGTWEYSTDSGATWNTINLEAGKALLLDANAQLRFKPAANFHGEPGQLTVRLVETNDNSDSTTTSTTIKPVSGLQFVLGSVGGTSLFSAETVNLKTTVTNVNDRPTGTDAHQKVVEDSRDHAGDTVQELFGAGYSDAKDNQQSIPGGGNAESPFGGIAIVGNTTPAETGKWQYLLPNGEWTDLPAVAEDSALTLAPDAKLRFVPAENYNGTPTGSLTVRFVDFHPEVTH